MGRVNLVELKMDTYAIISWSTQTRIIAQVLWLKLLFLSDILVVNESNVSYHLGVSLFLLLFFLQCCHLVCSIKFEMHYNYVSLSYVVQVVEVYDGLLEIINGSE